MCSDNTFFLRTICVQNTWFLSVLFGAKCVKRAWSEISSEYMLFKGSFLGGEMFQNTGRNGAEHGAKFCRIRGKMFQNTGRNVSKTHILYFLRGKCVHNTCFVVWTSFRTYIVCTDTNPMTIFQDVRIILNIFQDVRIVLNIFQDVRIILNIFQDVRISY